jgi:UDP-N-acetylglucosamine transferase subunit ALG13
MDNHQVELAEALEKDNYVFYIKNLSEIITYIKMVLNSEVCKESEKNLKKLKDYPDFNLEVIPKVIYDMLEI